MNKRELTLKNVVTSLCVLSMMAGVMIPVIRKNGPSNDVQIAMMNAQRMGKAALVYAEAWEGVLPRLDNNGSCAYGQNPCAMPDSGNLQAAPGKSLDEASNVMFFGALKPYVEDERPFAHDPAIGKTNWQNVFKNRTEYGLTMTPTYSPDQDQYYDWILPQMAVNTYAIDDNRTSPTSANERPIAPRGRLNWFADHSTKILMTMESAWNWGDAVFDGLGNGQVWPSNPAFGPNCDNATTDGWTFYILEGTRGNGTASYGQPDRSETNPNLQGKAMFLFADGHAAPMTYLQAEACTPTPPNWPWYRRANTPVYYYYKNWVPEIE